VSAASCLACAKGTEISPTEIVILPALPAQGPDGGADAAVAPIEPAADTADPDTADPDTAESNTADAQP
jgi:hypothetical protein